MKSPRLVVLVVVLVLVLVLALVVVVFLPWAIAGAGEPLHLTWPGGQP